MNRADSSPRRKRQRFALHRPYRLQRLGDFPILAAALGEEDPRQTGIERQGGSRGGTELDDERDAADVALHPAVGDRSCLRDRLLQQTDRLLGLAKLDRGKTAHQEWSDHGNAPSTTGADTPSRLAKLRHGRHGASGGEILGATVERALAATGEQAGASLPRDRGPSGSRGRAGGPRPRLACTRAACVAQARAGDAGGGAAPAF